MLRISKAGWLILGIGILAIACGGLYVVYNGQVSEQERLNSRLAAVGDTLPKLISEKEDLESQLVALEGTLAEAKSLLSEAKAKFPKSVESIEYDEVLFGIADDWDLEITGLTASEPSAKEIEGITFSVTSFTVDVEGKVPESPFEIETEYVAYIDETVANILDFITTITTSEYFTVATIELVKMEVPESLTREELEQKGTEVAKPSATIELVIYGYKGE